jgi:hypothetical protein
MAGGRPTSYNKEIGDRICEALIEGKSLRELCREDGMPAPAMVCRWLANPKNDEFRQQYARAREYQADTLFDESLEIADDASNDWMLRQNKDGSEAWTLNGEHIQRSRLRVDTRKWMAGKLAPKKYGEKLTTELTGKDGGPIETVDLSPLEAARRIAFALEKGSRSKE